MTKKSLSALASYAKTGLSLAPLIMGEIGPVPDCPLLAWRARKPATGQTSHRGMANPEWLISPAADGDRRLGMSRAPRLLLLRFAQDLRQGMTSGARPIFSFFERSVWILGVSAHLRGEIWIVIN